MTYSCIHSFNICSIITGYKIWLKKDRVSPCSHGAQLSEVRVEHMPVRVLHVTDIHMNKKYPQFGHHGVDCGRAGESFLKEVTVKLTPEN